METNNLGSKKKHHKQNTLDEFSKENITENNNPVVSKLVAEVETNSNGDQKIVHRARNSDDNPEQHKSKNNQNPSSSIEIFSDKKTQRMVENNDHNSDITAHRYKNTDPDNHEDRGNIKLDK
jgi:hypothetical protein